MTLIVHGTWAHGILRPATPWWRSPAQFWRYVNELTGTAYAGPDSFQWSGGDSHAARIKAAKDLVRWVEAHPVERLDLITHSHGGNVALLALGFGLGVRKLITLALPVRLEYPLVLDHVEHIHNVYSIGDDVNPLAVIPNRRGDGRTLPDGEKVTNHLAEDDGRGRRPGHSALHEPATWDASGLTELFGVPRRLRPARPRRRIPTRVT